MEVSKGSSNIVVSDDKTPNTSKNLPKVDIESFPELKNTIIDEYKPPFFQASPIEKNAISLSFIEEQHDMHWYSNGEAKTYGVKIAGDTEYLRSRNDIIKVDGVRFTSFAGNSNSFNIESQGGPKIKAGYRDIANAYVAGTVGVNIGWLDGSFTGGLGARGAVGAEVGPVYAEAFKEIATNYASSGYTVGLRIQY